MARGSEYWGRRRKKQFGRFSGKAVSAVANPSVGSIAKAAWSGVKYLRTLVNSERHKKDTNLTGLVTTTGGITALSPIAQGDGIDQRTGNSVLLSYISIRYAWAANSTAGYNVMRQIIFIDKQQVGDTAPSVADVLGASPTVYSHYNALTIGRFTILQDRTFNVTDASAKKLITAKFYKKLQLHQRYNGTATTDIQKNGLYILHISDQAVNGPNFDGQIRVGWHDN